MHDKDIGKKINYERKKKWLGIFNLGHIFVDKMFFCIVTRTKIKSNFLHILTS